MVTQKIDWGVEHWIVVGKGWITYDKKSELSKEIQIERVILRLMDIHISKWSIYRARTDNILDKSNNEHWILTSNKT